ncbi:MAG TPA: hypothetical protein VMJ73_12115 [Rhizomicrobium sp.]|nr:hypothetical protein [Rhizomicrobium sp.]
MRSIDPNTSALVNLALTVLLAVLAVISKTGLPAPWSAEWSHIAQDQAQWWGAILAAAMGVLNGYLHAVSSSAPGALSSDKH